MSGEVNKCGIRTGYPRLLLNLKIGVVALIVEEEFHIADHGQCLDVVTYEFGFAIVVGNTAFQWTSQYDEGEFWGPS